MQIERNSQHIYALARIAPQRILCCRANCNPGELHRETDTIISLQMSEICLRATP